MGKSMKKLFAVPLLAVLLLVSSAYSQDYTIEKLWDGGAETYINDNGDAIWWTNGEFSMEMFYRDGTTGLVTQLTNDNGEDLWPGGVADNGNTIWVRRVTDTYWNFFDTFYYDKSESTITQISPYYGINWEPSINKAGDATWVYGPWWSQRVFFYDHDTRVTTDVSLGSPNRVENSPCLADNGDLYFAGGNQLYFYDKTTGERIPFFEPGSYGILGCNSNRDILLSGIANPGVYVYENASSSVKLITQTGAVHQINNNGDVMWIDGYYEVYFYDNATSTISILNDETTPGWYATMNDRGDVAWWQRGGRGVYVYDSITQKVTTLANEGMWPQLNENGDVIWANSTGVWLAKRNPTTIAGTIDYIENLVGSGQIDLQMEDSLTAKLESALAAPDGNTQDNILQALINQIEAQAGKKIDPATAAALIESISYIADNN